MTTRLIQGDCLEEMKNIPDGSIDMILTDLPYGTTKCKWDSIIDLGLMWLQFKRVVSDRAAIVLFGSQPFTSRLVSSNYDMFKYGMIWKKSKAGGFLNAKHRPLKNHEDIAVFSSGGCTTGSKSPMYYNPQGLQFFGKMVTQGGTGSTMSRALPESIYQESTNYPRTVLEFPSQGKTVHPTQKPVALLEYLIKTYTDEGMTVLDATMGSGSTGVACVNTNRNFIGIEQDAGYFKICEERINGNA